MTDAEKREALVGMQITMAQIQQLAERLAGYVLDCERAGMELPAMKQTARILADVALGWEAGGAV